MQITAPAILNRGNISYWKGNEKKDGEMGRQNL